MNNLKRYIVYGFALSLIDIFKRANFSTSYKIAGLVSKLFIPFIEKEKLITVANVSFTAIKKDAEKLFSKVIQNMCFTFVEFIKFAMMKKEDANYYIKTQNAELIDESLKKGNGLIIITGHIGNWELLGTYLGKNNYKVNAIYRKPSSEKYDKVIKRLRKMNKVKLIDNSNAYHGSINALKRNEILIILADQNPGNDGIDIDFLGRPAKTPKGPAIFALKSKASIISAFAIRKKKPFFNIKFENINIPKNGKIKYKTNVILENINENYTQIISLYPEQWAWFHNRWGLL
ncbi:MAG: lysophospholipid acyltransferase family protein [Candidatus Muirbacterium halophilum]|nr:lysophospholipid acyltransferase family protein [Candidatus Muirbacterium halophilum]